MLQVDAGMRHLKPIKKAHAQNIIIQFIARYLHEFVRVFLSMFLLSVHACDVTKPQFDKGKYRRTHAEVEGDTPSTAMPLCQLFECASNLRIN